MGECSTLVAMPAALLVCVRVFGSMSGGQYVLHLYLHCIRASYELLELLECL